MNSFLNAHAPKVLSILRIVTGFLLIWHGSQKFFAFPPSNRPGGGGGGLSALMTFGATLEFVGGILFLIGFLTRPVAFLLSGMMAVAYFGWHAPGGFFPIVNGGELAALYCFVFFYFIFSGPGPWSVDALFTRPVITSAE